MAVNKVILGDKVVIDVSQDTAKADDVVKGKTFHLNNGIETEGNLIEVSNISFYKFWDLSQKLEGNQEIPTDEEYIQAETRLQVIYNDIMGEDTL